MQKLKTAHILLVEDNPGDITLYEEAFEETSLPNTLSVARDGQEAIDYLTKTGEFVNAATPNVILLDINLPKKSGIEVLSFIKSTDHLKTIPTIMLTSSQDQSDVIKAYGFNANCYIVKPVDAIKFMEVVQQVQSFWTTIAILPQPQEQGTI